MGSQNKVMTPDRRWFFAKLAGLIATLPVIAKVLPSIPHPEKRSIPTATQATVSINPLAVPRTNKDHA